MNRYLALLRGINVSGQKKILMPDLKTGMEEAGFSGVRTYIQSGNLVFNTNIPDQNLISGKIGEMILDRYGFQVPVILRSAEELEAILSLNPFPEQFPGQEKGMYVAFLYGEPGTQAMENLESLSIPGEYLHPGRACVYMFFPGGYGRAKLNNNYLEGKLKVSATTRNWKSVNTLYEMLMEND